MLFRTFLTAFSFIVGLALCTMGGIFILRQVTALTTISRNIPQSSQDDEEAGQQFSSARALKDALPGQFAFTTYSPGVAFMAGGVAVILITQIYALPVTTVEAFPSAASKWCIDKTKGVYDLCKNLPEQYPASGYTEGQEVYAADARATPKQVDVCTLPEELRGEHDFCTQ